MKYFLFESFKAVFVSSSLYCTIRMILFSGLRLRMNQSPIPDFSTKIRGLYGKYRAYLYISALALFFIIWRVASFKVIPTWLNNTVSVMFPLLETVMELTFRDGLEYAGRIIFNPRFVIESLYFEWFFEFRKQPKVTGGYVRTVQKLSKQCDTVFTQKLLHTIRWMRWRVIVVKKSITAHTRIIPKILFKISKTVVFGIPKSFSSSQTVNRRSPSIASRTRLILSNVFVVEGRPERESLSTEVRPPLKQLYHSFILVLHIRSLTKAFCIIWIVSELVFPS